MNKKRGFEQGIARNDAIHQLATHRSFKLKKIKFAMYRTNLLRITVARAVLDLNQLPSDKFQMHYIYNI